MDQIKEVVTIEEAVSRKAGQNSDYVIIYGVITAFDLDSENTDKFFRRRWLVLYLDFISKTFGELVEQAIWGSEQC